MNIVQRWIPLVAAAALVALTMVVGVSLLRPAPAPTIAEQAEQLAAELRCPDCAGVSIAESPTRSAAEIRRQIDALLADGRTADEVRDHFVDRYGEWILLSPRLPIAWALPAIALVVGIAALVAWLRPRSSELSEQAADGATDLDRRRVHDEAEALDA
jgi:cytochrome c-type biogenesis protein CcmH